VSLLIFGQKFAGKFLEPPLLDGLADAAQKLDIIVNIVVGREP
jgi:hypothetical protein